MHEFDVLLRLGPDHLGEGANEQAILSAVRRALSDIPGAGSVRLERSMKPSNDEAQWVVLSAPTGAEVPATEAWQSLRSKVRGAALVAIAGLELESGATGGASGERGRSGAGFADAQGFRADLTSKAPDGEDTSLASPQADDAMSTGPKMRSAPSDGALLGRLLHLVNPHADPKPLAHNVIRRFGSFAGVLSAPVRDLRATPGLGTHSVAAIKLVHEAALRLAKAGVMNRPVLDNWPRLIDYLAAQLGRERIEQFRVLFLDERDRLLADEAQARGTVNHTPVYPREVVRRALELQAASVILVHNHPSGDPTPSRQDLEMTAQVGEATAVLSIALRDHVIVGNGRWVSFRQEGLL